MSAASAWSYVHDATLWKRTTKDAWGGQEQFSAPITFKCDFIVQSRDATTAAGMAFVTKAKIFTERSDISVGDRVAVGVASASRDPIAAGADEVKDITRYPDTFDRLKDDFEVLTG